MASSPKVTTSSSTKPLPQNVNLPKIQQEPTGVSITIEILKSITPLTLASIGCVIGVVVVVTDSDPDARTAGFGLTSTAIAGAAGVAQDNTSNN